MKVTVTDGEGEKTITSTGNPNPEALLRRHGCDPEDVEYTVQDGVKNRLEELESGTGVGGQGKKGIAHRIDDLEQRIETLENDQS